MPETAASGTSNAAIRAQFVRDHAIRTRIAHERLREQRRHAELRQARERTVNIVRALASAAILGGVLAFGIYRGWFPETIRSAAPPRQDALDNFTETKTGQVVFTPSRGDKCRQFYFANESGNVSETKLVECSDVILKETSASPGLATGSDRLGSIRDSFMKK
jgi:hypothetical protein